MTVALVVFNVQITFDPHSLASIYVLFFLGAMLPKRCVHTSIIVWPCELLVDDLEGDCAGSTDLVAAAAGTMMTAMAGE
jgi:hypothetical protein